MTEDAAQRAVVEAPAAASGVIIGAPGTGKTRTLIDRVVHLLGAGGLRPAELLVLTPNRTAATVLRDRIGVRIAQATPGPLARSLGSFAFQLVRGAMVQQGMEPPALLTGADQDRIIAELLAGHEADEEEGAPSRWPAHLSGTVRASKDFRSELRAFIAECSELGVTGAELRATGREVWHAVAAFIEEYRRVLDHFRSAHRDAADLLSEAAEILRTADASTLGQLADLRAVLIDDAQELTSGGVSVVQALRERGVAVLAFGDPDISSGAFRGASPELFARLSTVLGDLYVLDAPHRQSEPLTDLARSVTQAIGVAGRVEHRRAPGTRNEPEADNGITTFLAPSPHEEIDRIAATLREWHLVHGVPWERMAVIAHDTRQVVNFDMELAAREVPTRAAGVQRPLGSEAVVRDILGVVRLAMTPVAEREAEALTEALRTPFGGLDGVGLRRLRAGLRHRELQDGGSAPARELLRRALAEPGTLDLLDTPEARIADRFATLLHEVGEAAGRGETIHELLWRVWDAGRAPGGRRLDDSWREAASAPGGAEAGRRLDALVALFDAAKRSVERVQEGGPARFIADILDSEVPEDSLSAPERPGMVTLLTPATALGTEFDAVVIAGVQEGVWPNVRLRGGMLETWRLADEVAAMRSGSPLPEPDALDRRRAALHDELRLFVRALSRARRLLLVTAVDDDDQSPSALFGFLPEPIPDVDERLSYPQTLRGLVARHRRTLTSSDDAHARVEAAGQLRLLAEAGVPGADPREWYGVREPSSSAPLRDLRSAGVSVSPSRLEAFEECGLGWVVAALGGDTVAAPSAGIGTILHAAMERVPDGGIEKLREVVAERWPELDFETAWIGRKERRRADLYVDRMQAYLEEVSRDGGRVVASESAFRFAVPLEGVAPQDGGDAEDAETDAAALTVVPVEGPAPAGHALVSGVIDRVETYPPGAGEHRAARGQKWDEMTGEGERVVVVDLKSGKYEPDTEAAVAEHAQLAAYQIAVQQGLVADASPEALVGARLVIVSKTVGKSHYRVAHQHTLGEEQRTQFLHRVVEAGRGMAASGFTAQVQAHCEDTQVYVKSCRIHTVEAVSS